MDFKLTSHFQTYSWTELVPDDEIYYFKNALNMERVSSQPKSTHLRILFQKEASPLVSKADTTLPVDNSDIDVNKIFVPFNNSTFQTEERHVGDPGESPTEAKVKIWSFEENLLHFQDPNWLASQPKLNAKSKSGYILFSAEVRKRIMSENPEKGFGEVSKMVGVEWKKLTDEQVR